jgi:chromosome segregation ATPase
MLEINARIEKISGMRQEFVRQVTSMKKRIVAESTKWDKKYASYQERCNKWQNGLVEVKSKVKRVVSEKAELKSELRHVKDLLGDKDTELRKVLERAGDIQDLDASIFSLHASAKEIENIRARNRSLEEMLQAEKDGAEDRVEQLAEENRFVVVSLILGGCCDNVIYAESRLSSSKRKNALAMIIRVSLTRRMRNCVRS